MEFVRLEKNGPIAEIILNRPPVNALTRQCYEELYQAYGEAEQDRGTRVLIIRSALPVFIAGTDIYWIHGLRKNLKTREFLDYVKLTHAVNNRLEILSKPMIAYIDGHAMGGGLELALACDFRFMTTGKTRIGLPEVKLGLIPGSGGTQRLTRLIGETKAKELCYTGRHLSAEEAFRYGIVSRVVPPETGLEEVYAFARELAAKAPIALASIKRCIQAAAQDQLQIGLETELSESPFTFTSEDAGRGMEAFINKTAASFTGN